LGSGLDVNAVGGLGYGQAQSAGLYCMKVGQCNKISFENFKKRKHALGYWNKCGLGTRILFAPVVFKRIRVDALFYC